MMYSYSTRFSVPSCSSPEWATVITIEHTRGTEHKIAVDVFHSMLCDTENGGTHNIQQSERRGHLEVNHAQQLCGTLLDVETILSNRNGVLQEKLAHGCSLFVRLEECAGESSTGAFKFHVRGLDCQNTRRNFLDRPDFVFEIRRKQRGKTQDSWYESSKCSNRVTDAISIYKQSHCVYYKCIQGTGISLQCSKGNMQSILGTGRC